MSVTTLFPTFPAAPNRQTDAPATFSSKADAFIAAMYSFPATANVTIGQMNTLLNSVNTYQGNAAGSASSAANSATSASASATTATTAKTNAQTYANNAATSASGAETSATNAAQSASNASASASSASASAASAASSEASVTQSSLSAASSAENALSSQTSAAESALSASSSASSAASSALIAQGAANFKGVWSSETTYLQGESVYYDDNFFVSVNSGNLGNIPDTAITTYWINTSDNTSGNASGNASASVVYGNILSPLTWIPLKNNLLTQQGQNILQATRGTMRTIKDRYSMLKSVSTNMMAFNENGLSLEGASTNLILYSEQFDNAAWTKSATSITANPSTVYDPYGSHLADKMVENSTTGIHQVSQSATTTASTTYTFSVFAIAAERTKITLYATSTGMTDAIADFDLTAVSSTVVSNCTADIVPYRFWSRCSISYTTSTGTTTTVGVRLNNGTTTNYTGDGTSGLCVFGGQLEPLPFASSYIVTTTAIATRAGNNCFIPPLSPESEPYYCSDFTVLLDYMPDFIGAGIKHAPYDNEGRLVISITESGGVSVVFNAIYTITYSAGLVKNTKYRIGVTKTSDMLTLYIDGVNVAELSISTCPTTFGTLYFAKSSAPNTPYGKISNVRLYEEALTAQEVAIA